MGKRKIKTTISKTCVSLGKNVVKLNCEILLKPLSMINVPIWQKIKIELTRRYSNENVNM